jgi:hypothetical protein
METNCGYHQTLRCTREKNGRVAIDEVTLVYEEHRLILVRLNNRHMRILFIVAHAPHIGSHFEGGADKFWETVETQVTRVHRHEETLVLMTDANAQLKSQRHDCVEQAQPFLMCLEALGLNEHTTDDVCLSEGSTLISYIGKGKACQIYYIATDGRASPTLGSARALSNLSPTIAC